MIPQRSPTSLRDRLTRLLAERAVRRAGAEDVQVDVRLVFTARCTVTEGQPAPERVRRAQPASRSPLPPLRERRMDIPLLVQHFRARIADETGMDLPPVTPQMMAPLLAHQWTGNVRELETWVERLAYSTGASGSATPALEAVGPSADFVRLDAARVTLEELERRYVLHVYELERGHQRRCAERLGIDRRTLYRKLKEYRDGGEDLREIG